SPVAVEQDRRRREDFGQVLGEIGITRRRVLDFEEGARESAEVVDRPRSGDRRDAGPVGIPVRRDRDDRAWTRKRRAERLPVLGPLVRDKRVHRASVSDEERGHAVGHDAFLSGVGPMSLKPLCQGHPFWIWSAMLRIAMASSARAIASGPASMGRNPIDRASSSVVFFASASSDATYPSIDWPSTSGSACFDANA